MTLSSTLVSEMNFGFFPLVEEKNLLVTIKDECNLRFPRLFFSGDGVPGTIKENLHGMNNKCSKGIIKHILRMNYLL
jgi:hypothetical protein